MINGSSFGAIEAARVDAAVGVGEAAISVVDFTAGLAIGTAVGACAI